MQKEGYNGLIGLERGKHCKKTGGKQQKIEDEPCPNRREREREKFEKLLKSEFEQVKLSFFKNLIHDFQLIENQFRLIETDIGSLKILKKNIRLIEKQPQSIEILKKTQF